MQKLSTTDAIASSTTSKEQHTLAMLSAFFAYVANMKSDLVTSNQTPIRNLLG